MAFCAAPFHNWSPTTQRDKPLFNAWSTLSLPTAQDSFSVNCKGVGYWFSAGLSMSTVPEKDSIASLASGMFTLDSNSALMLIE